MATRPPKPDKPVSFGFKCAWYAAKTDDGAAVAAALGLRNLVESPWARGIAAAYADNVFVTPPLGEWVLAAGWKLFYDGRTPAPTVLPILKKLSKAFGEAQYFASYRVPEAHCWALARDGKLVRAFGFVGERGECNWNEGRPTNAERALGRAALEFPGPDESHVMKVAAAWSIDPSELESGRYEPGVGRLGEVA
jgi:hypothetical protein